MTVEYVEAYVMMMPTPLPLMTGSSSDGPFQLLHADVENLEFLGKNATFPQYVLLIADLYTSKVYTYLMKSH